MPALSFWISLKSLSILIITLQLTDKCSPFPEMFANGTLPQVGDETKIFAFHQAERSELHYGFNIVQRIRMRCYLEKSRKTPIAPNGNQTWSPPTFRRKRRSKSRRRYLSWSCRRWSIWFYKYPACRFGLKLWKWVHSKTVEMRFHSALSLQHCFKFCRSNRHLSIMPA